MYIGLKITLLILSVWHFSLYIKWPAAKKMDYIHTKQQSSQHQPYHVKLTWLTNLTMLSIHSRCAKFFVSELVRIWSLISTNKHMSCEQVYIKVTKITQTITKNKIDSHYLLISKLQLYTKLTSSRREQVLEKEE